MDKTAPLSADMLKGIVGGSAKQRGRHMTDLLIVETENGVEVHNPATKADHSRLAAPKLDASPTKAELALHTGAPVTDIFKETVDEQNARFGRQFEKPFVPPKE
jgi:hypothetical protein